MKNVKRGKEENVGNFYFSRARAGRNEEQALRSRMNEYGKEETPRPDRDGDAIFPVSGLSGFKRS